MRKPFGSHIVSGALYLVLSSAFGWASVFVPPSPPRLEADGKTSALYELKPEAVASSAIPDLTGKVPAGKLVGKWQFIRQEELQPGYAGAAKVAGSNKERAQAVFTLPGVASREGFSVDVLLRWNSGGGFVLQMGDGNVANETLLMGMLRRGPGQFELRVPVKTAAGEAKIETLASTELYHVPEVGPVRLDDFYTYSLVFDGKRTFTVFINSWKVFEGTVKEGEVSLASKTLVVGDVGRWGSRFDGAIAAVRISQGVREYAPAAAAKVSFSATSTQGWTFDAGTAKSPVSPGAIALVQGDAYSAERGYGWLQPARGDFDAWYSPGRYDVVPQAAFGKKTYKIHNALMRDGVAMPDGEVFRADVPSGSYWVTVGLGNSHGSADVTSVWANGTVLGTDLRMRGNIYRDNIPHRLARGLVRVENGKGIILSGESASKEGLPIQSITILPYAPLPVVWKGSELAWQGEGAAPAAVGAVSKLLAGDDFAGAVKAADGVTDPLVKACVLACALGKPKLPEASDIAVAQQIRQLLLGVLREHPDNTGARWLLDSTERFRHALIGYTDERGTELVYGAKDAVRNHVADQGLALRPEDPEYWQGRFIAGAAVWQNAVQRSSFGATSDSYLKDRGPEGFKAPGSVFREVIAAWPDFRIARIMLGEKLPTPGQWQAPANAPQWAALQYELLTRIVDTIHYWVNERMDANGLLGGGLGDDVEALRWWSPGVTLADDRTTISGFTRLSEAAWGSTQGKGFALTLQDVEHSAEDISDSQPMRALTGYGTPEMKEVIERLTIMKPVFRDVWTGIDPAGYRMFKGHYLSATQVGREGDVPYNLRALRPLLWGAWVSQGKDKELDELLVAYARNWRDAIMAEFDGKPRGIVPMMIMWGHKKAKLDQSDGHLAARTSWVFPGYWSYAYPTGYAEHVYDLLLAGYELSGDKSFLEPIQFALQALGKAAENDLVAAKYPEGSFEWALRAGAGMIGMAGANYRVLTGDTSYDDVLLRLAPPHSRFMILAARAKSAEEVAAAWTPVIEKLKVDLAEMNTNPELRTTMVQSTDRIYVCGAMIIDAMATGVTTSAKDLRGGEIVWPTYQITWGGTEGRLAALVAKAAPVELDVRLYNFGEQTLKLRPRVWRLLPGRYQLTLEETDASSGGQKRELAKREIAIESRGQEIAFELPSRIPAKLSIVKK